MMCKFVVAVLGVVLALSFCYAQKRGNNSEMAIKTVERELEAALSKGDVAQLERIVADDYLEITTQGDVKKKADVLAGARAISAAPRAVVMGPDKTVDDLTIHLHGDCAVVAGRTTIRYHFMEYSTTSPQTQTQNPVTVDQERFTRVYSKMNGRWQLVAWQTTFIPKR